MGRPRTAGGSRVRATAEQPARAAGGEPCPLPCPVTAKATGEAHGCGSGAEANPAGVRLVAPCAGGFSREIEWPPATPPRNVDRPCARSLQTHLQSRAGSGEQRASSGTGTVTPEAQAREAVQTLEPSVLSGALLPWPPSEKPTLSLPFPAAAPAPSLENLSSQRLGFPWSPASPPPCFLLSARWVEQAGLSFPTR